MRMTLVRTITIAGFTGDANPNVTPPAAGTTFVMANKPGDQMNDERVEGHRMCVRFVDNANAEVVGPTVDFTTWAKDDEATAALGRPAWIGLKKETAAPSSQSYASTLKGELFVQLAVPGGTGSPTKMLVYAEEATSVPG
jgi:hypothetical protein